jgi:hypothetical protein
MRRRPTREQVGLFVGAAACAAAAATAGAFGAAPEPRDRGARSQQPPTFIKRPAEAPHPNPSDSFYNYDGQDRTVYDPNNPDNEPGNEPGWADRDWPVTIIWTGEASKYKVIDGLHLLEGRIGNPYRLPYKKTSKGRTGKRFNSSVGRKDACNDNARDTHIRFYGQTSDNLDKERFFDPVETSEGGFHWFVVSTTHFDHAEEKPDKVPHTKCFGSKRWFGRSEGAAKAVEGWVNARNAESDANPFGSPKINKFDTKNPEGGEREAGHREPPVRHPRTGPDKNHWWSNDGRATLIEVK